MNIRGIFQKFAHKILCVFNCHDYECTYTTPSYAMLYCFYCPNQRKSYALPKTKEEAGVAYEKYIDEVTKQICSRCDGTGQTDISGPELTKECSKCDGTGHCYQDKSGE